MFTHIWQSISTLASDIIATLDGTGPKQPIPPQTSNSSVDPLVLPDPPDVMILLSGTELPTHIATDYEKFFNDFITQFSESVQTQYRHSIVKLSTQHVSDASVQISYLRALRHGLIAHYTHGVQQALLGLKSRLASLESQPNARPSSPAASSILGSIEPDCRQSRRGRPFVFSKEQTAVLRALLAHDDQFSTEEKELIAQALNLTRAQVNRWFCNARARGGRKKPYEKPIPRAQRQNLGKYVSDVCQKQRSTSSSSSSGSSTCSQYPSSDDDVDMWPSNALQQNSDSDESPYLTTEVDPSENIIPMSQLYSQISSTYDETSPETIEIDQSLTSSNFSFSQSTSSSNEFLLPNELSLLLNDPDPFNLNTLSDNSFVESFSYSLNQSNQSEQSWNFL